MGCGSSVPDEELTLRNAVMIASKTPKGAGLKEALDAFGGDIERTKAACGMLDKENIARCMTPLKHAVERNNVRDVQMLIDARADVNVQCMFEQWGNHKFKPTGGFTPIMHAALLGRIESAKLLVEANADVNYTNILGQSAADIAGIESHWEVQEFLKSVMTSS